MAHRTARLNVFGRQLLVTRVELDGWSVAKAAEAQGVSRQTAHKWVTRYRAEGWSGLEDRRADPIGRPGSRRPRRSRRSSGRGSSGAGARTGSVRCWASPPRPCTRSSPAPATPGCATPTASRACRSAVSATTRARSCTRTTRSSVGSLSGGGHRLLGRATLRGPTARVSATTTSRSSSTTTPARLRRARPQRERVVSAAPALLDAAVWFAERGVRIERVLTDNASAYTSPTYQRALESIAAGHRRTRPYRPQTNGKAERFIKTLLAEWAYGRLYRANEERLAALPGWVAYYNNERTHTALGGITPTTALVNNLRGNHS